MTPAKLKSEARGFIKANLPKLIFITLIYIAAITLVTELEYRLPAPVSIYENLRTGRITLQQFSDSIRSYGLLLALLLSLMTPTVIIGYQSYCLKLVRKLETGYRDLLTGFHMFLKVIGISVVTSFFIMLWSFLFVIPGIIAYYRYRLAYYILLDDPTKKVMQCINESKHLMYGKKLELFLIDISFIMWFVLNILVLTFIIPIFPVVALWLEPYYGLVQASFYNYVIKQVTI